MKTRTRQTSSSRRMPPGLKYRSGVGKALGKVGHKRQSKRLVAMAAKPLRMREWLEDLLDNNTCKCLKWVDKSEKKFEITWCHASRHDFDTKEHADLFLRYAEFQGNDEVMQGGKNGYNSKLKSNFRSALHSLVDCIPAFDASACSGRSKGENTMKVYQFIDSTHPEYKRKKLQKNKNQRKHKKGGASEKSKSTIFTEPEVKQEFEPAFGEDIEYTITDDDVIILPDDALHFLTENGTLSHQSAATTPSNIPVISELPSTFPCTVSSTSTPTEISVGHCPNSPLQSTHTVPSVVSNFPQNVEPPQTIEFEIDWSRLQGPEGPIEIHQPSSSLPNFNELGVNDTFDDPINHASQILTSGGSMRVRKDPPKFQLPTIFTQLTNVQIPLAVESITTDVSQQQEQYTVLENVCLETLEFPSAPNHIIDQNDRVIVERLNYEPSSQGENYDLFDVGSF